MVTKEEIMDIALLSKLHIDDDEIDELTKEMMNIIKFADTINGYDGEVEEFDNINNLSNVFREDVVGESFLQSEILKNVDGGENGYFPVKKKF
ncbi:MAG: Asp-tRNA(Asn)/Glu-tRNA(Gln) amidotransferase subunit GatC [Acutalibacteraceae bacterium]|nr:Asp-tRNA(Asn)/Glu-tRNA(Gln) amidotransferase subunit GatC [Acutalibacteraceae bacterium]